MPEKKEEWRPIRAGYEVSCFGRVRSLNRIVPDGKGGSRFYRGRILKPMNRGGYLRVRLPGGKYFGIHQLVAAAFIGPCPIGHEVNHKNTVKSDNDEENLEYLTSSQNQLHAIANGCRSYPVGEKHPVSVATETQIIQAYNLVAGGMTTRAAAASVRLSASSIQQMIGGHTWKYLNLPCIDFTGRPRKSGGWPKSRELKAEVV